MKSAGKIIIVVGGHFGSEGKGRHVEEITKSRRHGKIDIAVRTGAPNAGHTVYHDKKAYAMQQIPCSWIDKKAILVLGAGAQIYPEVLTHEIDMIEPHLGDRAIMIDRNAIIQDHSCMVVEQDKGMHESIGSTAEGDTTKSFMIQWMEQFVKYSPLKLIVLQLIGLFLQMLLLSYL